MLRARLFDRLRLECLLLLLRIRCLTEGQRLEILLLLLRLRRLTEGLRSECLLWLGDCFLLRGLPPGLPSLLLLRSQRVFEGLRPELLGQRLLTKGLLERLLLALQGVA